MHQVIIQGQTINYQIHRRRGTRRISISISPERGVRVSLPWFVKEEAGEQFIRAKADWIIAHVNRLAKQAQERIVIPRAQVAHVKRVALHLVKERLEYFNQFYRHTYKKVSIRQQKTRWGSCSKSGTLSFNIKLALIDPALADYVVVHELCHVKEMNHSPRFWALVTKTVPDYKERRKRLKSLH